MAERAIQAALPSLPDEIIFEILSRLPVKAVLRFRCVCKLWRKLFNDPGFVKLHYHHVTHSNYFTIVLNNLKKLYFIGFDESKSWCLSPSSGSPLDNELAAVVDGFGQRDGWFHSVMGSSNGWIFLKPRYSEHSYYLWNPSTNENKTITKPKYLWLRAYGFAFDSKSEDYKIASIPSEDSYNYSIGVNSVEVYSLRSNAWQIVQENIEYRCRDRCGVFVNCHLHWMAVHHTAQLKTGSRHGDVIISFDVGDNTIKLVRKPEPLECIDEEYTLSVGELQGCLCLLHNTPSSKCIDVWVMKDYEVKESWTMLFSIENLRIDHKFVYLMKSFKNRMVLLEIFPGHEDKFVLYDPTYKRAEILNICGIPNIWHQTLMYHESLISLNSASFSN